MEWLKGLDEKGKKWIVDVKGRWIHDTVTEVREEFSVVHRNHIIFFFLMCESRVA